MSVDESPCKRTKLDVDRICAAAWLSWHQYLESCEDADDEIGEIDQLFDLLESVEPVLEDRASQTVDLTQLHSTADLLPILASVAATELADEAIGRYLHTGDAAVEEEVRQRLLQATRSFGNASAWSMAANFARMTERSTPDAIASAYRYAAQQAAAIRSTILPILRKETKDTLVQAWIEGLLLNQVAGVEFLGDSMDDDSEADRSKDTNDDGEGGFWSSSTVEATARFMTAMLDSVAGRHGPAKEELTHFDLSHRLHPNVWLGKIDALPVPTAAHSNVVQLGGSQGGILPTPLYQRLCDVFAPDAAYWKESDYANRGYYSYFIDRPSHPTNLLEEVICHHLLPPIESRLSGEDKIVGFEWWVHTRSTLASLGHNLHFDTDEALLAQEGLITHPVYSSVLYLTGDDEGGPTIVLDQTPENERVAETCWRNTPCNNSLLLFPGNLLHGVLPCQTGKSNGTAAPSNGSKPDMEALLVKPAAKPAPKHRLTFMVGFWTRRVPDTMKSRRLYGPCGPMPPATTEHTWVQQLSTGYAAGDRQTAIETGPAPLISPAWEALESLPMDPLSPPLQLPKAIDHRFFVKGAPQCFRESLFERDEFDEQEEDDDDVGDEEEESEDEEPEEEQPQVPAAPAPATAQPDPKRNLALRMQVLKREWG